MSRSNPSKVCVFLPLLLLLGLVVVGVKGYHGYEEEGQGEWLPDQPPSWGYPPWGPEEQRGHGLPPGSTGGGGEAGGGGGGGEIIPGPPQIRRYILKDSKLVVATNAGGMRVVKGAGGIYKQSPMHIGFITMEPNTLFLPQYLDSSLILFVNKGEARVGSIYYDELVENDLKTGDLYRIEAGSAFYIVNRAEGQRLQIIACIDTAESSDEWNAYQPFFLGGGSNPVSVLSGFDINTIAAALNVSYEVVHELLSTQKAGPITYLGPLRNDTRGRQPTAWNQFLEQGKNEREMQMKKIVQAHRKVADEKPSTWSWRNLFTSVFGNGSGNESNDDKLDSYNIYNRKPDFRNDYGWSTFIGGDDYTPLRRSDIGAYIVNLTAGSMMAPHVNPRATEYGVVLSGTGNVQVVFPNGTLAMNAEVKEGDVFWIPRYFPFCQVASSSSPFVFFGFATSAHDNMPQFLVGQGSLLEKMMGPELASGFGLREERLRQIISNQNQSTIMSAVPVSPGGGGGEIPGGGGEQGGGGQGGGGQGEAEGGDEELPDEGVPEGGSRGRHSGGDWSGQRGGGGRSEDEVEPVMRMYVESE